MIIIIILHFVLEVRLHGVLPSLHDVLPLEQRMISRFVDVVLLFKILLLVSQFGPILSMCLQIHFNLS